MPQNEALAASHVAVSPCLSREAPPEVSHGMAYFMPSHGLRATHAQSDAIAPSHRCHGGDMPMCELGRIMLAMEQGMNGL